MRSDPDAPWPGRPLSGVPSAGPLRTGRLRTGLLLAAVAAAAACSAPDDAENGEGGATPGVAARDSADGGGGDSVAPGASSETADVPRVALRAAGIEPTWAVNVTPGGQIRLVTDAQGTEVVFPAPAAPAAEGGAAVWRARGQDGTEVEVRVTPEPCEDESAEPRPYTVTVRVGDLRFRGCGRPTG